MQKLSMFVKEFLWVDIFSDWSKNVKIIGDRCFEIIYSLFHVRPNKYKEHPPPWLNKLLVKNLIFYILHSLCFSGQNQMNYNQFSESSENTKKLIDWEGALKAKNFMQARINGVHDAIKHPKKIFLSIKESLSSAKEC